MPLSKAEGCRPRQTDATYSAARGGRRLFEQERSHEDIQHCRWEGVPFVSLRSAILGHRYSFGIMSMEGHQLCDTCRAVTESWEQEGARGSEEGNLEELVDTWSALPVN